MEVLMKSTRASRALSGVVAIVAAMGVGFWIHGLGDKGRDQPQNNVTARTPIVMASTTAPSTAPTTQNALNSSANELVTPTMRSAPIMLGAVSEVSSTRPA